VIFRLTPDSGRRTPGVFFWNTVWLILAVLILYSCTPADKANRPDRPVDRNDDMDLADRIRDRLLKAPVTAVSILDLKVKVFNGHAYLVGVVDRDEQVYRAVEIARDVGGVRSVTPYVLVGRRAGNDSALAAAVVNRLAGNPDLASGKIEVEAIRGHVVLMGVVSSRDDIRLAVALVRTVEGVRVVKSFLFVR
jgi:hyperosmotically inducible protein